MRSSVIIGLSVVAIFLMAAIGIYVCTLPRNPSVTYVFIGELEGIRYLQGGYGYIQGTYLIFNDMEIYKSGYWVYEIGSNYRVIYSYDNINERWELIDISKV